MSDHLPRRSRATLLTVAAVAVIFAGFSLLHVPIPGVNEPHYLCKARATWDPDWCAGDFFLQSQSAHSVFFEVTGYFTRFWSLTAVAVAGRVLSALLLAWGWTALTLAFQFSRTATVVSAALLAAIALTGNLSGEWILGGFESKVPAWGLGLAGTARWLTAERNGLQRPWVVTGVLLGLSTAAHPVVGTWFLIAVTMCELAQLIPVVHQWTEPQTATDTSRAAVVRLLVMNGTAVVMSLPGVIPALRVVLSSDLSRWDRALANRIQVFMRLPHHLDPARFPPVAWIHSVILLSVVGYCSWRLCRGQTQSVLRRHLLFVAAAMLIASVGVAVGAHNGPVLELTHWSWRAFLLKFYPFRLIDMLMPVTAAITVTACLADWLQDRIEEPRTKILRMSAAALVITVLALSFAFRRDTPAGYSKQDYLAWQEACDWIRRETPKDSLFVTPRESAGFKWFAERAEFVCWKDCPQDGAGILEWRQRLRDLGWMRPIQLQRSLKPSDLQWMEGYMNMTHLITRDHHVAGQQPIYENEVWRIYDVP